jgi:hypothetical protein
MFLIRSVKLKKMKHKVLFKVSPRSQIETFGAYFKMDVPSFI